VDSQSIEQWIRELSEKATTADDSEVLAILEEPEGLLAEPAASVIDLAEKTLHRLDKEHPPPKIFG
jgi:hypothetical protein